MSVPKIYIESCPFIDMAKNAVGNLPKDRNDDVWFCKQILNAARAGDLIAYTSTLTVAECQDAGGICDETVQKLFKGILTSGQFVFLVQDTLLVAERARDLLWVHGLKLRGADAIHLASAAEMECTEFVTVDGRLHTAARKKAILAKLGIKVTRARDTNLLPHKYRQLGMD